MADFRSWDTTAIPSCGHTKSAMDRARKSAVSRTSLFIETAYVSVFYLCYHPDSYSCPDQVVQFERTITIDNEESQ